MIGTEKKLYRVQINTDFQYYNRHSFLAMRNAMPLGRPKIGIIRKGITGTIIMKWGRKYFSPDINQAGIEEFTPQDQPHILIPYKQVANRYKILR